MRSLTWRRTLRVIAVLSWIVAIAWLIADPGFEPLLAFLTGAAAFLGSFAAREGGLTPDQHLRNRRTMLELVKRFWVKGVLEQSLHDAAMIELGMEEKPGAVEHPWDMVLQTDREDRALPAGTKMLDVFDEMGGSLLILGEPGSGKTTVLLELARDTIARAEEDPTQPIPVVFNLSSWAEKRQSIAEWLVEELNTMYNIPKRVARPWVENDDLLLLLDGLDEVKREYREDCVRAINDFRQEHLVPLVVCSRVAAYQALTTRLRLEGAVLLQPLTPQEVDEYLGRAGIALSAVRETLQHDPTLQELAETPLMLSVMTLAYRGISVEELGALGSVEDRRRHIFDAYVEQMFKRVARTGTELYHKERVTRWLAWLAKRMTQHAQTVFLIERMQPRVLQPGVQQRLYTVASGMIACLILFLLSWWPIWLISDRSISCMTFWLVLWLGYGLIYGLKSEPAIADSIRPIEVVRWSWKKAWAEVRRRGIAALKECTEYLPGAVFLGVLLGVLIGWDKNGLIGGVAGGVIGGVAGVLFLLLLPEEGTGHWLVFRVIAGFWDGLDLGQLEATTIPNVGIQRSLRYAVVSGLIAGVVSGSVGGHFWGLGGGLALALFGSVMSGLYFGGAAVVQHYTLRFTLSVAGDISWNYARFLDYAAERIFLRKVGGGYIFIHRLLQDHFASLYQGQ